MKMKSPAEIIQATKKALETATTQEQKTELENRLKMLYEVMNEQALRETDRIINNTVYHRNFKRLEKILGDLAETKSKEYLKLESAPYMALSIDILRHTEKGFIFSMAHNYEQNGDLIPDPDMEIEINLESKTAEALTFQNSLIFSRVYEYNDKGEKIGVRTKLKKDLNGFLEMWTRHIIQQGHKITEEKKEEAI